MNTFKTSFMKHFFSLLLFLFFFNSTQAQEPVNVWYTANNTVLLNQVAIDHSTGLNTLQEQLGEAVLYKEFPNGKKLYHFPQVGMAGHFVNDKLLFLGVNLNWDGDDKFPEQTFMGNLKIGETVVDADSTSEVLSGVEEVKIICPVPVICMTEDRNATKPIMVSFKEDKKISQLGIEFHQPSEE